MPSWHFSTLAKCGARLAKPTIFRRFCHRIHAMTQRQHAANWQAAWEAGMGTRIVPLAAALATALLSGTLLDGALCAQEPAAAGPAGNLLAQVKWLRLEIVGGRIVVKSERCPHSQHVVEATPGEGIRQVLALESRARILTLRYE